MSDRLTPRPATVDPARGVAAAQALRLRVTGAAEWRHAAVEAVVVGVGVYVGIVLGSLARFPDTSAAILYPPYAVLTAALLAAPPRRWWALGAAAVAAQLLAGGPLPGLVQAAAPAPANILRAVVAAALLRRAWAPDAAPGGAASAEPLRLDTLQRAVTLIATAGMIAPAVGATVGAASFVLAGRVPRDATGYVRAWVAWFLSGALTGVTLLPAVLTAWTGAGGWRRRLAAVPVRRRLEAGALAALLALVAAAPLLVPARHLPEAVVLLAAPLPLFVWAAIRFGPGATGLGLVVLASSAVTGMFLGRGAFAGTLRDGRVLSVYLFLALTAVPCLLLAALTRERERAAAATREAQDRYAWASRAAGAGVWEWAPDTNRLYLDAALRRALGHPDAPDPAPSTAPAVAPSWEHLVHPDDWPRLRHALADAAAGRAPSYELEYRLRHADGAWRWFLSRGAAVRDGDGRVTRVVGIDADVTARRRADAAEAALRERQREVAHLARVATVGQISGALAHELRQPLAAILANAQAAQRHLGRRDPDMAEVRAILDDIVADDTRAAAVIARLRRMFAKDAPRQHRVALRDALDAALQIAQSDLTARGVAVERRHADGLPDVRGDDVELQQVFVNLVLNACEAMAELPPAARRLTVGTRRAADGGVVAFVADRGPGIAPDRLDRIFEPFETSKAGGMGLGLTIGRALVAGHGGRLSAENAVEGGAVFSVWLPSWATSDDP